MKILSRYVLREHLGPLTFALTALTSLLLLNYIAKQFGQLVGKGLPWAAIAQFFALSVPFTVELTLPMAVLIATLHAFSRLAAENEVTALKASGVSLPSVMRPVLFAAVGVTVLMVIFNDQIIPWSNHRLAVLQSDIAQKKPTFALREQVINEVSPGKLFLRASHLDEGSNRMRDVTIYDLSDPSRRRTIYADSGNIALARNQSDLLMTLYHGSMLDVPVSTPTQLQRLFFTTDLVTVKGVANQFQQSQTSSNKGNREMSVCEMQRGVMKSRAEYLAARMEFLNGVTMARRVGVRLDPSVAKVDTRIPSSVTLGGVYCSMLHALGVRSLGAQAPTVRTRMAQAPARGLLRPDASAPPTGSPTPHPAMTIAPRVRPAPVPGRITAMQGPPAPSAGFSSAATPSTVEIARLRMADAEGSIASNEIEIHKKFALAVACFVFVLLGAPIALRFPRGGVGVTIGVSLFVFALYYIGLTAGASLAAQGLLPPAIAMWAANVIFAFVALLLLRRMGAEGTTARGGDSGEVLENLKRRMQTMLVRAGVQRDRRSVAA